MYNQIINTSSWKLIQINELNAKKRKITNIKPGVNKEDVVTLDQTLIRKGDGFEQLNNKYEFF